jgi:hypothetical protein
METTVVRQFDWRKQETVELGRYEPADTRVLMNAFLVAVFLFLLSMVLG